MMSSTKKVKSKTFHFVLQRKLEDLPLLWWKSSLGQSPGKWWSCKVLWKFQFNAGFTIINISYTGSKGVKQHMILTYHSVLHEINIYNWWKNKQEIIQTALYTSKLKVHSSRIIFSCTDIMFHIKYSKPWLTRLQFDRRFYPV